MEILRLRNCFLDRRMHRRRLWPCCGSRRSCQSVLLVCACALLCVLVLYSWLDRAGDVLLVRTLQSDLQHLRDSRQLDDFIGELHNPLIEPSSARCEGGVAPVLAVVSSSPGRRGRRQAIRDSWGSQLPTYFFLGLQPRHHDEMLVDNYVEAKQHSDLVVFEFTDSYHNLTLKTALMLQWVLRRCPQAQFLLKTDDDVLVNPWTLQQVLQDHAEAQLVGYRIRDAAPHRNPYNKWFLPRWLYPYDTIPEYLSGTGYLLSGETLPKIYEAAFRVPLINLEDIFFTYLVARQTLGLELTHDQRLSPRKPVFPVDCAYWSFASIHSLDPGEIVRVWSRVQGIAREYEEGREVCQLYDKYFDAFSSRALLY